MNPALSFAALLNYNAEEAQQWHSWFKKQPPAALEVSAGAPGSNMATVRGLLLHIFAVEMRYAQRLLGLPVTDADKFTSTSLDEIFAIGDQARAKLTRYLAQAKDEQLKEIISFQTLSMGTISASRQKVLAHAMIHSVRHWGQLATLMRQAGYKQDWPHDFLFSKALD